MSCVVYVARGLSKSRRRTGPGRRKASATPALPESAWMGEDTNTKACKRHIETAPRTAHVQKTVTQPRLKSKLLTRVITMSHSHSVEGGLGWYPCKPSMANDPVIEAKYSSSRDSFGSSMTDAKTGGSDIERHPFWDTFKYVASLVWAPSIQKDKKNASRRYHIEGVEIRDLGKDHALCGEKGLFATKKFEKFDVLGEYTGKIVDASVEGHYVACLEDKAFEESFGVDAGKCGNEMRFINSYINVAFKPNVTMRTTYVNTYPHILIVCTEDIEEGDEILLDYGKAYTEAYLTAKPQEVRTSNLSNDLIRRLLPRTDSDSSLDSVDSSEYNNAKPSAGAEERKHVVSPGADSTMTKLVPSAVSLEGAEAEAGIEEKQNGPPHSPDNTIGGHSACDALVNAINAAGLQ